MLIIAALANNIFFFIIILLCWCPPFGAQLQDCFADKRSSLMQINQFLYRDDVATIARVALTKTPGFDAGEHHLMLVLGTGYFFDPVAHCT